MEGEDRERMTMGRLVHMRSEGGALYIQSYWFSQPIQAAPCKINESRRRRRWYIYIYAYRI